MGKQKRGAASDGGLERYLGVGGGRGGAGGGGLPVGAAAPVAHTQPLYNTSRLGL